VRTVSTSLRSTSSYPCAPNPQVIPIATAVLPTATSWKSVVAPGDL